MEERLEPTKKMIRIHRAVLCLAGILALCAPLLVRNPYTIHLLVLLLWTASCGVAWNILGGYGGQLSIGHAVFIGLGAYTSAIVQAKWGLVPLLGIVLGVIVAAVFAFVVFYPCFALRGAYFTMATLAISLATRNIFLNWDYIGKAEGILIPFRQTPDLLWFQFGSRVPYYYTALAMLVVFLLVCNWMSRSRLGYALRTVRENEYTAASVGVNNPMIKASAAILSMCLTAVAGAFYFQYVRYIDPDIMMIPNSVEIILPVIIGGMGTLSGPVLGALVIFPVSQFLRGSIGALVPGSHWVAIAVIMILVVELRPAGISGFIIPHYWRTLARFGGTTGQNDRDERQDVK